MKLRLFFVLLIVAVGAFLLMSGFPGCGIPDGPYREYYPNGQLKDEATYKDGELEGFSRWYYEDGRLKGETVYRGGEINGLFRDYYENGRVRFELYYKNGLPDGVAKFYDRDGHRMEPPPDLHKDPGPGVSKYSLTNRSK